MAEIVPGSSRAGRRDVDVPQDAGLWTETRLRILRKYPHGNAVPPHGEVESSLLEFEGKGDSHGHLQLLFDEIKAL